MSRYAPNVVATMDDRVHQYVDRLDPYLVRDCTIAALNKDMDIARCNTPYLIACISHCYMCWSICIDPKLGIYEFKYEY